MHTLVAYIRGECLFTGRTVEHTYMGDSCEAINLIVSNIEPSTLDLHINGVPVDRNTLDILVRIFGV